MQLVEQESSENGWVFPGTELLIHWRGLNCDMFFDLKSLKHTVINIFSATLLASELWIRYSRI